MFYWLSGTAAVLFLLGVFYIIKGYQSPGEEQGIVPVTNLDHIQGVTMPVQEAQGKFDAVSAENDELKKQIERQKNEAGQWEQKLAVFQNEHRQIEEQQRVQIENLRSDIQAIGQEKQQLLQDRTVLTELKTKTEMLQQHNKEYVLRIDQLTEELKVMMAERENQKVQADARIQTLDNEKHNLLIQLAETKATMEVLKKQQEGSSQKHIETLSRQLSESMSAMAVLKKEKEELTQREAELIGNLKKLEEFNAYLLEKENILEYELAKNRAQALGFEKICEDFKIQLDGMNQALVEKE